MLNNHDPQKDEWWIIEHKETKEREVVQITHNKDHKYGIGYMFIGSRVIATDGSHISFVRKVEIGE